MRKALIILALGSLILVTPGVAEAGHGWLFGGGFKIGGFHFSLGFRDTGYAPTYYYRTHDRVAYRGYKCSDRCYRSGRTHYHHEACPVISHHLDRHRLTLHTIFARHAPYYDGRYARGYDRYYRSDRYGYDRYDDRYDRSERRRYHRRGHRHDRSCPYD
ncbi:MAG: hypothetical protein AAF481_01085 [Acidobacteriota bacterium]